MGEEVCNSNVYKTLVKDRPNILMTDVLVECQRYGCTIY